VLGEVGVEVAGVVAAVSIGFRRFKAGIAILPVVSHTEAVVCAIAGRDTKRKVKKVIAGRRDRKLIFCFGSACDSVMIYFLKLLTSGICFRRIFLSDKYTRSYCALISTKRKKYLTILCLIKDPPEVRQ